jgi:hypothetical protein
MADNYLKLDDVEQALTCLEHAAEHAVKFDTLKDGNFTAFMVNKVEISSTDAVKDYEENRSGLLIQVLKRKEYARLQNHPRMHSLVASLGRVAIL